MTKILIQENEVIMTENFTEDGYIKYNIVHLPPGDGLGDFEIGQFIHSLMSWLDKKRAIGKTKYRCCLHCSRSPVHTRGTHISQCSNCNSRQNGRKTVPEETD